jgi:hypothetical protein
MGVLLAAQVVGNPAHPVPRLNGTWSFGHSVIRSCGSAMSPSVIIREFIVPTVVAIMLGIALSIGAVYLTNRYLGSENQAEQIRVG